MKGRGYLVVLVIAGAAVVGLLSSLSATAQGPTPVPSVWLQSATPGTTQTGHFNISGTGKMGRAEIGDTLTATIADVLLGRFQSFRLGTSAAAAHVLKTDASGVGTWQPDGLSLPFSGSYVGSEDAVILAGSDGRSLRLNPGNGQWVLSAQHLFNTAALASGLVGVYGHAEVSDGVGVYGDSKPGGSGIGVYGLGDEAGVAGQAYGSNPAVHSRGKLLVSGNAEIIGTAIMTGFNLTSSPTASYVLTSDASGVGTWQPATGLSLPYSSSANVTSGAIFSITNTAVTGTNSGLYGQANSGSGRGVSGVSANGFGVYGETTNNVGVYAIANAASGTTYGVYAQNNSATGRGVYGQASGSGTCNGVRGFASAVSTGYGVYSNGDTGASGTKAFVIDHPFDPENKYLKHYSSEGPEPLNVYTGNVVTDEKGVAWVELPNYFSEINKDFRYTLTVVDDSDSEEFIQAKVARKIRDNRFKIRTSQPNVEVSWRVDGVRNDLWVRTRGAPVEVVKDEAERGKYQHPELYGQPKELGMDYTAQPTATRRKS